MENNKPWWASKTIWTGLVTVIFTVLSAMGILPAGVTEGAVNEVITSVLAILTIVFRFQADTTIGKPPTQ